MTVTLENNTAEETQKMLKRRAKYNRQKSRIQSSIHRNSVVGGVLNGIGGLLAGIGANAGMNAFVNRYKYSSKPILNKISSIFNSSAGRVCSIIAVGLGVAAGGAYLTSRYGIKKANEKLDKLNIEYADILMNEEIKESKIDASW